MRCVLERGFGYNRYCYNRGLEVWQELYEEFCLMHNKTAKPNERKVRNILVNEKPDWAYEQSSRILQQAVHRLGRAWDNYFNPTMKRAKKPKFKAKHSDKQSFTTDRARVDGMYLILDQPRGQHFDRVRMAEPLRFAGDIKTTTITKRGQRYFASITVATAEMARPLFTNSYDVDAIDMNIKHLNSTRQTLNTLPDTLEKLYARVSLYQRVLAHKRAVHPTNFRSANYCKIRKKLNQTYLNITNLQQDMLQKFSRSVLDDCQTLVLEDLDVNAMKMNKHLAKNIHRGLFRRCRDIFTYKSEWEGKGLVVADRYYPSTQRCSNCGHIKTIIEPGGKQTLSGDSIHRQHGRYYCNSCGTVLDRDANAVQNLIQYAVGLTTE